MSPWLRGSLVKHLIMVEYTLLSPREPGSRARESRVLPSTWGHVLVHARANHTIPPPDGLWYCLIVLLRALGFWHLDSRANCNILKNVSYHHLTLCRVFCSSLVCLFLFFHHFSRFTLWTLVWTLLSSGCMSNTLFCSIQQTLLKVVYSYLRAINHWFERMHLCVYSVVGRYKASILRYWLCKISYICKSWKIIKTNS